MSDNVIASTLMHSDAAFAESAWQCPIEETEHHRKTMRDGAGLVLNQEGLVSDLSSLINRQVRREANMKVGDRIALKLVVSPEVWWAIYWNFDKLATDVLIEDIEINQVPLDEAKGWSEVKIGDRTRQMEYTLYAKAELTDSQRFSTIRAAAGEF